jgi:hypothetical protein
MNTFLDFCMQTLEQQLQAAQDAVQKKDLEVQVCKVEFDARSAEERLRFASEIKARNEELLALRMDRDDCVRQWAAEKSAMQEEIKARRVLIHFTHRHPRWNTSQFNELRRLWRLSLGPAAEEQLNWRWRSKSTWSRRRSCTRRLFNWRKN